MAYIRAYGMRDSMGDPFRFRLPKRLRGRLRLPKAVRKFQPGRAIAPLARLAAGFIPGVGGIAAQLIPGGESGAAMESAAPVEEAAPEPVDIEGLIRSYFARAFGMDMGDPMAPRRKRAGAGPKVKANAKANARVARQAGPSRGVQKRRGASGGGGVAGGIAGFLGQLASRGAGGFTGGASDKAGAFGESLAHGLFAPRGGAGVGGGHRHINPTNVKALRRAIRRQEGFIKLARRVAPTMGMKLVSSHAGMHSGKRGRSHKAGCRCAVCSRSR